MSNLQAQEHGKLSFSQESPQALPSNQDTTMSTTKSFLDLVKATDNYPLVDIARLPYVEETSKSLYRLLLPNDPRPHAFMLPSVVQRMPWTSDFSISHAIPRTVQLLDSSNGADTAEVCNAAFRTVIDAATEAQTFREFNKVWPEDYKILGARYKGRVQLLRAAAGLFGISCRGAHMTLYTRTELGELKIWVSRRSRQMVTWPGKLDTTVAGGVRAEESPFECIVHEADEEASLPESFVRKHARPVGVITYVAESAADSGGELGLCVPDVLFCYDLEVTKDVIPKPHDDEVEAFYLMSTEEVKEALLREEFKTNCASVMIDFFVRHGIITDDNEPDYLEIVTRLHRPLPVPTSAL
ncbi:NUDIX hydrolase domain-like protein [Truncatella angustata]|uniref:NUDIX hydrolase domain-like protein n=1 Tax=Truncatella angustata TaxID=152316 RepID=A0A9P9A1R1_9PEZI|nr:NUDIX hydrolase domain-like protein [Truncatella angustata]KAH6659836.1 NUDIX hydrolase domain-like protein [Truncatella angustata]